jgi:hypothetical protein
MEDRMTAGAGSIPEPIDEIERAGQAGYDDGYVDGAEVAASEAPTWRVGEDGEGPLLNEPIARDDLVHVVPRVAVEVEIVGGVEVQLTAPEARRLARVLDEAADRIERGDGFAR